MNGGKFDVIIQQIFFNFWVAVGLRSAIILLVIMTTQHTRDIFSLNKKGLKNCKTYAKGFIINIEIKNASKKNK